MASAIVTACTPIVGSTDLTAGLNKSAKSRTVPVIDEGLVYHFPKYLYRVESKPVAKAKPGSGGGGSTGFVAQSSSLDDGTNKKKKESGAGEGQAAQDEGGNKANGKPAEAANAVAGGGGSAATPPARPDIEKPVSTVPEVFKSRIPGPDGCQFDAEITVTGPYIVADPDVTLLLTQERSAFRTEQVGLNISSDGLLESADTMSTGELDQLIKILAQIAGAVITGVPTTLPGQQPNAQVNEALAACPPLFLQTKASEIDPAQSENFALDTWTAGTVEALTVPKLDDIGGVYYRALKRVPVTLKYAEGAEFTFTVQAVAGPISHISFKGSLFSDQNSTSVRFVKGVPVSYDRSSPSEAVAIAKLPLDLVNAFLQLPLSVLTFRVQMVTQESALTAKQLEVINNLLEMKKKESAQQPAQ
ncbi:hypothetical protein [Dongia sp.]|uniref:hypothetical protein n=1 Tax=Dongia sp. TaxID=1977262 RepID=UPI0035B076EF